MIRPALDVAESPIILFKTSLYNSSLASKLIVTIPVEASNTDTVRIAREIEDSYDVPVLPISAEKMNEIEIMEILKFSSF